MSALRIFVAVMLLGVGIAVAVAMSGYTTTHRVYICDRVALDGSCARNGAAGSGEVYPGYAPGVLMRSLVTETYRPGWVIPVSILIGFVGLAGAAAVLAVDWRRAAAS